MAGSNNPSRSRALIAPELLAGLDRIPPLNLNDDLLKVLRAMPLPTAGELSPEQRAIRCEEKYIPGMGDAPPVRVLIYHPPDADASHPAYLHLHGGGFVLGSPEIADASNRSLAAALGLVIMSVDYRLAPETRHPGPVEDCYAALRWLHANASSLGIDPHRVAIGGESAGAGYAASLSLMAKERALMAKEPGELPIAFQLLDAPMLDDRTCATSSPHPYCGEFVWTAAQNRFGWQAMLGVEPGSAEVPPDAAPARATQLEGLPPTFILVGALDLFLEEDMDYARRLIRAGVPTELHVIPGAYHGFGIAGPSAPQVQLTLQLKRAALSRALELG